MSEFNLSANNLRRYRRYDRKTILPLFKPKHIAIFGATDASDNLGKMVLWNLIRTPFGGIVSIVNSKVKSVLGLRTIAKLSEISETVDVAIIANPLQEVSEIIDECQRCGVKSVMLLSPGLTEKSEETAVTESLLLQKIRDAGIRLLGPNSSGFIMPHANLNASVFPNLPLVGNVGFISQSNSTAAAILDWSLREKVGFSAFITIGEMVDVDISDVIYYLGEHPHTNSIVMCLQNVRDARSFLSAAREVALSKPIIVLKSGYYGNTYRATPSEAPEMLTQSQIYDAAFRRCGVLPVKSLVDLFAMSEVLAKQPPAKGKRLAIISNAGSAAQQAKDRLEEGGGQSAELTAETVLQLKEIMPQNWIPGNPLHLLRQADGNRYAAVTKIIANAKEVDGVLVILSPHGSANPTDTAKKIAGIKNINKPLLASWMGGDTVAEGKNLLNNSDIPTFPFPETAAAIFNYLWKRWYNLQGLFETPSGVVSEDKILRKQHSVEKLIEKRRKTAQTILDGDDAAKILTAFEIVSAKRPEKTDFRLRGGSFYDATFGPVLYIGAGSRAGLAYRDFAAGLPPLNTTLAKRMMEQTRLLGYLYQDEKQQNNLQSVENLLIKLSYLVIALPVIKRIGIEKIEVGDGQLHFADAVIELFPPDVSLEEITRPAIRPYPVQYIREITLRDGSKALLRPIRPEDEPLMVKFHQNLSDRSVYLRYFYPINLEKRISHERLARICFIDYDREMVLVAERTDETTGEKEIIAVGRLNKLRGVNDAEYAVTIDDRFQKMGLGTTILQTLVEIAKQEGLDRVIADILPENTGMQKVGEKVGFKHYYDRDEQVIKAVFDLSKLA